MYLIHAHAPRDSRSRRHGFSLLEMVFAAALLAGTLAPALAVMRDSMAVSRETTVRSLLVNYARQKLEEQSAAAMMSWSNGTVTGNFSADGHAEIRYSVVRSDAVASGGIVNSLMSIRATVYEDLDSDSTLDSNELQLLLRTKVAKLNTYQNEES